jgi:Kdo2-lipid IVA lauroyltransferase/acyltransferase
MKEAVKHAWDHAGSIGISLLIRIIRRVDYPVASLWGARIGRLACRVFSKYRRRSIENLTRVFGDEQTPDQREAFVKIFFENFFRNAFELVPYGHLPAEDRREYVHIVGKEKLDEALALGRGVISLSAHLGNFLILMSRLAVEGYPVDLVLKRMKNERFEDRMRNLRRELGYHSIYVNPRLQSVKASLASLKDNHVLVMLGDQRPRQGWIDVTFFGMPARAAAGPVSLSLSTGAPVVPMFMARNPDGISHTLFIDDPLEMVLTGSKKEDIRIHVQKYTDVIQSYVRRFPAQWMWGHRRWAK